MTVVMKIDLVGPERRGLALGLNEAAGYGGVALAAGLSGWLAAEFAARDVLVVAGAVDRRDGVPGLACCSSATPAPTSRWSRRATTPTPTARPPRLREAFAQASYRVPALRSCSQAGLVNNLNDGLAWGLVPLFLAAHGAERRRDRPGRRRLSRRLERRPDRDRALVGHDRAQAADRRRHARPGRRRSLLLALSDGAVAVAAGAAALLGLGTALVYPTLIAAISDAVSPVARAPVVGVYRFWRDMGYALGALIAGATADALGYGGAIALVAGLTAASGLWVLIDMPATARRPPADPAASDLGAAQPAVAEFTDP